MTENASLPHWIILRTAPSSTVRLAEALAFHGAWTPTETRIGRAGRARSRRQYQGPVLPMFVFAPSHTLKEMLALSHSPALTYLSWDAEQQRMVTRGYPFFTVFQVKGEYPRVPDRSLEPLRLIEAKLRIGFAKQMEAERRTGEPPRFDAGTVVRVSEDGPYAGLDLVVIERNEGKLVKLSCPGWVHPLEVSAWGLQPIAD